MVIRRLSVEIPACNVLTKSTTPSTHLLCLNLLQRNDTSSSLPKITLLSPYGSFSRNRNTRHPNLQHRQTVYPLQHHPTATSTIVYRAEEIFRFHHPARDSYVASRCHPTSLAAPEIMVHTHHLESATDRRTKKGPRTLSPNRQPSDRPQMAQHQRLALLPESTQHDRLCKLRYSSQSAQRSYRPREWRSADNRPDDMVRLPSGPQGTTT